ncbi:hypothetical protein ACHAWO_005245 [Cyclotella atomus]|uniref:Uncharacterized protein n=1 Tax=Cyclotella atomus TaxID=382360 RepID=A0ABD3P4G7_9STRA
MNGAFWESEMGPPSPSRTDWEAATSFNNNYFNFGEDSSFGAAETPLPFINEGFHSSNDTHLSSPPKKAAIQIIAEDELKIPATQFQFSPISLAITEYDATNTFDRDYQISQKTCTTSKRTITQDNVSQNDTPHHAPKRLKNSDESEPSVNDNCLDDNLDLFPEDGNFDTNDSERSRVKDKLTSALDDFCSVYGDEELDSFFVKYKASRDNSKQLAHPRPRSPSNRPAMIEKMLGMSGFEGKLVLTATDLNGKESNSQFDSSIQC